MAGPVRFALDHSWITIPIGIIGPGIGAALFEYLRLGREFDATSIWVVLAGSTAIAVCLLSVRVRALTMALEQSRSSITIPERRTVAPEGDTRPPPCDGSFPANRTPEPVNRSKPRCLRTPEELVAMTEGVTSVELDSAAKDQIGLWLEVNGEIRGVWDYRPNRGVSAMLILSSGALVYVNSDSDIWNKTIVAAKVGDRICADGMIDKIGYLGQRNVWLINCELTSIEH